MPTAGDRYAVSAIALKYRQATLDLPSASIRTPHNPHIPQTVRSLGSRDLRGLRPPQTSGHPLARSLGSHDLRGLRPSGAHRLHVDATDRPHSHRAQKLRR